MNQDFQNRDSNFIRDKMLSFFRINADNLDKAKLL